MRRIVTNLIRKHRPEILLCPATSIGRSVISRVAVQLRVGLTADCTGLDVNTDERYLLQTRPAFGGNIMATILSKHHRPQLATVRHKVMKEAAVDPKRKGAIEVVEFDKSFFISRAKVLNVVDEVISTVNIAEANVIVSGGRAMGGAENFKMLEELAKVLMGRWVRHVLLSMRDGCPIPTRSARPGRLYVRLFTLPAAFPARSSICRHAILGRYHCH